MEFAVAVHRIWQERRWLLPVAVIAAIIALNFAYHVSLVPPRLESRSPAFGSASTHLLVDSARSSLPDFVLPVENLGGRAQVYAELLRTEAVRERIGEEAGIPWTSVQVDGSTSDPAAASAVPEPSAAERAVELQEDEETARVFFRVDPSQPIIRISTQGRTAEEAVALAQAAADSLADYIDGLQEGDGVTGPRQVELTQLGSAEGGTVNEAAGTTTAVLVAIAVFGTGCLLILFIPRFKESLRSAQAIEGARDRPPRRPWPWRAALMSAAQSGSSLLRGLKAAASDWKPASDGKPATDGESATDGKPATDRSTSGRPTPSEPRAQAQAGPRGAGAVRGQSGVKRSGAARTASKRPAAAPRPDPRDD